MQVGPYLLPAGSWVTLSTDFANALDCYKQALASDDKENPLVRSQFGLRAWGLGLSCAPGHDECSYAQRRRLCSARGRAAWGDGCLNSPPSGLLAFALLAVAAQARCARAARACGCAQHVGTERTAPVEARAALWYET